MLTTHRDSSAREIIVDRLADLMFNADDLLDLLQSPEASSLQWMEADVRRMWDRANEMLKRVCD